MEAYDLTTMGGIMAATITLTGLVKMLVQSVALDTKVQRWVALGIALALTVASKSLGIGFSDMDWLQTMVLGLGTAAASGTFREHVVKAAQPGSP